ncbi:hypothetical protein LPJ72_005273 [Coemansia sp. Benny D160-2]|nr:hypothetical protein LPJ72_005273 [Coemansia sp. Benny D160-2]
MAKAFESLFGSVTCLPGCFCMYRLRAADDKPLLIAKPVLEAYSELHVDTLHKKNLLSLGEDRYLTTLMMKHFPHTKLKFIQDAKCKTIAPEKWSVLMSQRRRWINSTIHNLAELMFLPDLCGFCCFSMRFVVFLDLFGTLTMPTTLFYFAYLIYIAVTGLADVGFISLILIGAIYGVQAIIFILRREWQHIGWMFIYLLAYPLWSFVLPVYSFWHMDDFSWGNTRVVVGDGKRKLIVSDDKAFDPESIPRRRWGEYEADLTAAGLLNAPPPNMNPTASSSREDERMTMYSRQSQMMAGQMRVGSMYGFPAAASVAGFGGSGAGVRNSQYAMMYGSSTRPGTPTGFPAAGAPDHRYSMAAAMAMQQPFDATVRSQVASVYGGALSTGIPDYSGVRSPSPAVMAGGSHTVANAAGAITTQSMSHEHTVIPGLDIFANGAMASMPDMAHQRPLSFAPTMSQPVMGNPAGMGGSSTPPSDAQLVEAIRQILRTADLNALTKKKVRQQLCQQFGTDLAGRKDFISDTVDRILSGNL